MAGATIDEKLLRLGEALEGVVDTELKKLDEPDELERIRQRRLEEMKRSAGKQKEWRSKGHGALQELPSEKDFFAAAKESENVVCHFFRNNKPCKILDEHLEVLARQHEETRFIKVNAENSPFLTEKLRIKMLPTLALLQHGKVVDYVVGLDELGGLDFPTEVLEARLAKPGVIQYSDIIGQRPPASSSVRRGGEF